MARGRGGKRRDTGPSPSGPSPAAGDVLCQELVDEITWFMRQRKVTRADLASAMGVSPGRVSQILSGDENLTLRTLGGVLAALDARLEVTLRSNDEPTELLDGLEDSLAVTSRG